MKKKYDIIRLIAEYKRNPEKWRLFYDEDCMKRTTVYDETIAEEICKSTNIFDALTNIEPSKRCEKNKKYKMGHDGYSNVDNRRNPERNNDGLLDYNEKNLAIAIYNNKDDVSQINAIGKVIDYEVPMKADNPTYDGKVDIIAKDEKCLNLIELKCDTKESILRALLEACTYYQRLDRKKLLQEWDIEDKRVEITLLLEKGGNAAKQACELEQYKNVSKLLQKFSEKLDVNIRIVTFMYNPQEKAKDAFILSDKKEGKYKILLKTPIVYEILK